MYLLQFNLVVVAIVLGSVRHDFGADGDVTMISSRIGHMFVHLTPATFFHQWQLINFLSFAKSFRGTRMR